MSRATNVPESLLKYETPILVSSNYKSQTQQSKKQQQPSSQDRSEDYLNKILPPQEIQDGG